MRIRNTIICNTIKNIAYVAAGACTSAGSPPAGVAMAALA